MPALRKGIYLLLSVGKLHHMFMLVSRKPFSRHCVRAGRVAVGTVGVLAVLALGLSVGRTLLSATAFNTGMAGTRTRVSAPHMSAPQMLFAVPTVAAETSPKPASDLYYTPLPQETGAAGLKLVLRRLNTTARLMQVTAHPDDEDGGMLTLESRGKGVSTLLMTLTRGEGGQNKLGSNLFDALGVLRTLELLASDRYYGVEQRFSRVADFGYSKTAEETFQKWHGHDIALGDMVRVIRTFHPDVLVARFSGTPRDGHGHHQASAILTKEAFRAAGDPKRFPEQIAEGLEPWQPKKLYIGNVCGFFSNTCDATNYTLRLNTGANDAVLGTSYIQFAMKGLRHQLSQGSGSWTVPPGDHFTYYKLVDSVVDSPKDKEGHEQSFFDGIDTSLAGLASRLGAEEAKAPWLKPGLTEIQTSVNEAQAAAEKDGSSAVSPLSAASVATGRLIQEITESRLSPQAKGELLPVLQEKWSEFGKAIALTSGVNLHVVVDAPVGSNPEDAFMAVPGQTFEVTARLSGAEPSPAGPYVTLQLPQGWNSKVLAQETKGKESVAQFKVYVPPTAELTRPYWHRNDPETEALNIIDDARYQGLPFPPPPVKVTAMIGQGNAGEISAVCMVRYKDASGEMAERPLAVAPAFSVLLDPGEQVIPMEDGPPSSVKVDVASNLESKTLQETHWEGDPEKDEGMLRVAVPEGWGVEPAERPLEFHERGERQSVDFTVHPGNRTEGREEIRAALKSGHLNYDEGYSVVTRDDLGTFYYYQPALQHVSIVDVTVPKDLKVGYIMGAGDEIPTVLQQIGMDVTLIPANKLATEDLSKYQTIVLGIRAYDTQKDVIANNRRLLDFVHAGGRLVVQYNTVGYNAAAGDFNSGKFTPYPATLSRARVSVEQAPVKILQPANPIFHFPNEITQKDFDGWVQERGLYFMSQWDANFTPLLDSHDPGESEQKGGLLLAHYGKGTYIYTGYAFFRQLPAGVPGAVRLFVNLVAGR
jgi:LmbE family N-acetylglucosaminyl deacetylase